MSFLELCIALKSRDYGTFTESRLEQLIVMLYGIVWLTHDGSVCVSVNVSVNVSVCACVGVSVVVVCV